jgi:hypothetical protein
MSIDSPDTTQISSNALVRILFVVAFNVFNMIVGKLVLLLALYQFLSHLITGKVSARSVRWGEAMSNWTYQMFLFMTYKTERKPFPFNKLGQNANQD